MFTDEMTGDAPPPPPKEGCGCKLLTKPVASVIQSKHKTLTSHLCDPDRCTACHSHGTPISDLLVHLFTTLQVKHYLYLCAAVLLNS